jgi:hypothetical protein
MSKAVTLVVVVGMLASPLWAQAIKADGSVEATAFIGDGSQLTNLDVEWGIPISSLPFTITQPGTYYLTGNLTGTVGGITISADDVTLDLNGFSLSGGSGDGISVPLLQSGIGIRNGTVQGWGEDGVDAELSHSSMDNGGVGLKMGSGSVVRGCVAYSNTLHGITTETNSTVVDSAAYKNTEVGIQVKEGSLVTQSTAGNNLGHGIYNITGGATISHSSAFGNSGAGIYIDTEAGTISNCTATTNGLAGLAGELGSLIVNSTGQSNVGAGIAGQKVHVVNSVASENGNHGMVVADGSTVRDSVSKLNVGSGITAGSDCLILDNQVAENGQMVGDQAGILVTGSSTRVEGNLVTGNDARGIDIDGTGNIIVRNHAYGNTSEYDIAASNTYGAIVTLASGVLGTSDPYANFQD